MTDIDYEAEYNNRARVPEHPAAMAGWVKDAADYRARHPPRVLSYGTGERHRIDLLRAAATAGRRLHPWRLLAGAGRLRVQPLRAQTQCPAFRWQSDHDLCAPLMSAIIACGWPPELASSAIPRGERHSAGGHLAACMLATDWPACDASLPKHPVSSAYAISGLFDLPPLVGTSINMALRMDVTSAKAASPLFWTPPSQGSLDAVVGSNESAEYFRQSRSIARPGAEIATRFGTVADANHFTAIAPLADPTHHGAQAEGAGPRLKTARAGQFRPCTQLF